MFMLNNVRVNQKDGILVSHKVDWTDDQNSQRFLYSLAIVSHTIS